MALVELSPIIITIIIPSSQICCSLLTYCSLNVDYVTFRTADIAHPKISARYPHARHNLARNSRLSFFGSTHKTNKGDVLSPRPFRQISLVSCFSPFLLRVPKWGQWL